MAKKRKEEFRASLASQKEASLRTWKGLGKTVSTIALLLKAGPRTNGIDPTIDKIKGGSLILCPMKWEREIAIKVAPQAQLSTLVYHDQNKRKATPETLASYDVVITTYGVVAKEVPYKSNVVTKDYCGVDYSQIAPLKKRLEKSWHLPFGPLATVAWHRVVLDEAQSIWNAYTQVSLSCRDLSATYRWGLSGTPLQNNIKDLFAFFRFLRISPHKSHADFKLHYEQFEKTGISATLKCIVLRRSKTSLIDGQPVLSLPPRLVSRVEVELSSPERQISESLRREYNNRIDEYSNEGTLQKNRFKILSMLLRLRQMYDHPALLKSEDLFQGDDLGEDNDDEDQQHMRQALNLKKLQLEAQEKQHDFERGVQEIGQSAKLRAAMGVLKMIPLGEKSLIFSQWTSMLDLIELELGDQIHQN
ncbi:helicase-like transcription factor CHR28 [Selaginella moellendorffii]|uniref:helicase-like transcription factor CHR28 n=1 Tax=Selaginella moellendorffii TaxID=88036 RepID=UPI000D1CB578|nr:helicase-like transcription factor CHR28 [Selaginella moellendorffii]|eukprot:XP_024517441.1 helicase-like transcription factor CHR28 [Selaginella moellendorffii]